MYRMYVCMHVCICGHKVYACMYVCILSICSICMYECVHVLSVYRATYCVASISCMYVCMYVCMYSVIAVLLFHCQRSRWSTVRVTRKCSLRR